MKLLTPKQVATSIGVSESSLKRWCDQGRISNERTPGGHRRIRLDEVIRFLREMNHPLAQPELIGLPHDAGRTAQSAAAAAEELLEALEQGDRERCRRIVIDLYLSGTSLLRICQSVLTPAMHQLGNQWECGRLAVYQEHRACEIVNLIIYDLRNLLPPPAPGAPTALGGTPPGDIYRLPVLMVELVLIENGWNASSLGSSLPFETLTEAANRHQPRAFWLSFSHTDPKNQLAREFESFLDATPPGMRVLLGGQQAPESIVAMADGDRVHFCASLSELIDVLTAAPAL